MNNLLERIEKALIVESSKANFIMDMDVKDRKLRDVDTGKVIMELPRYAAWGYIDRGKNEVIETSNDLKYLQKKYGEDLPIVSLTNDVRR